MATAEQLLEEVNKIKSLLEDPQPGLFTRHGMLDKRIRALLKLYDPEKIIYENEEGE